jgi:oxygen-independent coproporphyrinogen-3 oxidase
MANLGIYVQVPFCQTKCTYCNFHTGVVSAGRFAPYVEAACREIREWRLGGITGESGLGPVENGITQVEDGMTQDPHVRATRGAPTASMPALVTRDSIVDTVYVGGGTPSLLEPELLNMLLAALREKFECNFDEVTLEADPETVEPEKAADWLAAGFNRVSMGTQSFVDEELKAAGRMHRRADIYRAVRVLRDTGFNNISFDLIAGLPKQTQSSWRQSLDELIALSPEHVSIYMMEIDEGSRLGLEVLQSGARYSARELPTEESMAEFYELGQELLKAAGYEQYEISNWAKPGFASRHNLKYWRREPYLGFGAGAHSFSGRQRWANLHDAAAYVEAVSAGKPAILSVESVSRESALEEELFLGLRQLSGIDLGRIERQYGVKLEEKAAPLVRAGLMRREEENLRLDPRKLSVSNEVIVELLR